jgi:tetratricopeptide (TPR) repeat protein
VAWLDQLAEEHNNLRAALSWSLEAEAPAGMGIRLGTALWRFWAIRGYVVEGREWLNKVLEDPRTPADKTRARALNGAGLLAWRQGDYQEAWQTTQESVTLSQRLGDERGRAYAMVLMGLLTDFKGDPTEGWRLTEESVSIFRHEGDRVGLALSLNSLGELARIQNDDLQAETFYNESLSIYRELGHKRGLADLLHNLGYIAYHRGEYERAAGLFRESLDLELEQGNRRGIAECLIGLGGVFSGQGEVQRAVQLFAAAEKLLTSIGAALEPADQGEYDRTLAAIRAQLAPAEFQSTWEAGQALSPAMAIAFALTQQVKE